MTEHPTSPEPAPHGDPFLEQAMTSPADLVGEDSAGPAAPMSDRRSPADEEEPAAPAAGDVPGAEEGPADAVAEDPLTAAQAARDEYLALAQRTQADFENFRKRTARDAALAGERGVHRLAKELLPALDHFDLALSAARTSGGPEELIKGFEAIRNELLAGLARAGVEAFSPKGEAFDPTLHEAMVQQPVEGAAPGTVVEVYQLGYRAGGQVLRPARVIVAA